MQNIASEAVDSAFFVNSMNTNDDSVTHICQIKLARRPLDFVSKEIQPDSPTKKYAFNVLNMEAELYSKT
jgi:hypothetical protein